MSKQTFTPNKIISYFKTEWVVLLIVTVMLLWNISILRLMPIFYRILMG